MNEVATQPKHEIVRFREQLEARASEMKMALPAHITPEKFQRTIITTTMADPELLKADRQSLVLACMKAAQDGLLPDKREAAIVVFKENKKTESGWQTKLIAQYLPMAFGLRKKILQSGDVSALEVGIVYRAEVEAGKFFYEVGLEPPLRHRPMLELTPEQTTDDQIVAAYSIATMKDGTRSFEVMRRFEIDRVRETSKTGATKDRNGQPRKAFGPWVDWFPEMAKKTVMRRHAKTLPQSGDIIVDVEGQELDAGMSTARVLASQEPDAPQIEDRRREDDELPPHDAVTGEVLDDGAQGEQASDDEQPEPDKPKRTRRTRAQIDADNAAAAAAKEPQRQTEQEQHQEVIDETDDEAQAQTEQAQREAEERDHNGGMTLDESAAAGEEPEPPVDEQTGVTAHPAEAKADELIESFNTAETIIDLDQRFNACEEDRAAMPDEIAAAVSSAWQRNRKRLRGER